MLLKDCLQKLASESKANRDRQFVIHMIVNNIDEEVTIDNNDWLFLRNLILLITRTKTRYTALGSNGRSALTRDVRAWIESKQTS